MAPLPLVAAPPEIALASEPAASLEASWTGPWRTGSRLYQLSGEPLRVSGRVSPVPAGRRARIELYSDGRRIRWGRVAVGSTGRFTWRTRIWRSGRLTARISIAATATTPALVNRGIRPAVRVYSPSAGPGTSGHSVGVLHAMLRKSGYWAPRGDRWSAGSGKAVLAFRKVNDMSRVETPSRSIYRALHRGRGAMRARRPDLGRHWESDLSRQVLALFDGRRPLEVHATSSGAPATPTVLGTYRFYRKDTGTNSLGMVHSSYFHRGYAIHGFAQLPTYPASHGCLRVWVPNAWHIFRLVKFGQWITVYP